jgi:4-amino-4-deoxy-L-arabinose transferase-like glycosyltransferase
LTPSLFLRLWLILVAIALSIHLGSVPLLDADEGRNGEVGREMAATNDYVMPRIDGMPYLDKPIVYFAAEAAAMEVLGPTELAARLPAYLFTLLTALIVFLFARRVWNEEAGSVAAIVFLSMPLTLAFARTVIFDSALTLFMVGAIVAFYLAVSSQCPVPSAQATAQPGTGNAAIALPGTGHRAPGTWSSGTWSTIAWASIALGVLTKGPVAIAVPLIIAIPYAIKRKAFRALWSWGGLVAFVVIIAPWVWAVSQVVPDFLHYVVVTETAQRLATKALKRTGPPWYFVPYVIGGALPWSIVACFGWRRERRSDALLFVALWIAIPFLFFSISQSKRPQYILPVMPAIALAVAGLTFGVRAESGEGRAEEKDLSTSSALRSPHSALRAAAIVMLIIGLILVAAPFVHVRKMSAEVAAGVQSSALPMGIVTLIGAVGAIAFARRREIAIAALSLPIIAAPITANPLLQSLGARRSAKAFVEQLQPYANRQVVGIDDYTGSMQFYLRRPMIVVTPDAEEFTSNYIIRHYDAFASDPKSPVRRGTVFDPSRLYVVRNNDALHAKQLQSVGFTPIARDAHHIAFIAPNTIPPR